MLTSRGVEGGNELIKPDSCINIIRTKSNQFINEVEKKFWANIWNSNYILFLLLATNQANYKKDEFKFLLKETGQVLALLMAGHTKGVDRQ